MKTRNNTSYGKLAFTLVELIVVIVIIAVLATIAFISLQDYPRNARDGVRKLDLKSIEKVMNIHYIQKGELPEPDEPKTQSGNWIIGEFGTGVYAQIQRIHPLPVDPATKKYYKYELNSITGKFKLTASLENGEIFSAGDSLNCPPGFIPVPGNSSFATSDFCVAKYEMTYVDNQPLNTGIHWASLQYTASKTPISQAGNYPIANLTQTQAIQACQQISHNGKQAHLITNNEWMTIARNIENQNDNWSGGTKGNGGLFRGITHEINSSTSLGCATSNSSGLKARTYVAGTTPTDTTKWGSSKQLDCDAKRQHKLSNGEVIWDLAGNVWEHVNRGNNPNTTTAMVGVGNLCNSSGYWHTTGNPSTTCGDNYGPSSPYRANGINMGMGYMGNSFGTDRVFIRGGFASDGGIASLFTLYLTRTMTNYGSVVGFRCAF